MNLEKYREYIATLPEKLGLTEKYIITSPQELEETVFECSCLFERNETLTDDEVAHFQKLCIAIAVYENYLRGNTRIPT